MSDSAKSGLSRLLKAAGEETAAPYDWLTAENLDQNLLLDAVRHKLGLRDDAALARRLQVTGAIIRMLRVGTLTLQPPILLSWIQDATTLSAETLGEIVQSCANRR